MKTKYIKIILSFLMLFTLVACKDTGNKGATDSEKVTITYALWDSNQAKSLEILAEEFSKENPNIEIEIQVNGWNDYWPMLEASATGDSMPDTMWMHNNEFYKYASQGKLLDLSENIENSEKILLNNYPEDLVEFYNLEGKQYAIPKDFDTVGLWFNKKMFDEAGLEYPNETWDWDTLLENAEKLTKPDGSQYGYMAALTNHEGYYNFIYQNGGSIVTEDNKSGYDMPETIEALDFYIDFYRKGISPEFSEEGVEMFTNEIVAMAPLGSWQVGTFLDNDVMKENADVTVLPAGPNGKRASIFNGLGNAIATNTKHPEESWKWIEFLESKEGQTRQAELGFAIPAYEGVEDAWIKATEPFNTKVFVEMLDYAQINPYTKQSARWQDKANELLQAAFSGERDVKEVSLEISKIMNEFIEEEGK